MSAPDRIWVRFDRHGGLRPEDEPGLEPTPEVASAFMEYRRADLRAPTALDPDMPADELRLHMGELTNQEVLTARAAIRWANSAHAAQVETLREALAEITDAAHGLSFGTDWNKGNHAILHGYRAKLLAAIAPARAALSAVSRDDTSEVSDG